MYNWVKKHQLAILYVQAGLAALGWLIGVSRHDFPAFASMLQKIAFIFLGLFVLVSLLLYWFARKQARS